MISRVNQFRGASRTSTRQNERPDRSTKISRADGLLSHECAQAPRSPRDLSSEAMLGAGGASLARWSGAPERVACWSLRRELGAGGAFGPGGGATFGVAASEFGAGTALASGAGCAV